LRRGCNPFHRSEKSGSDDDKSFDASEESFDPDNVPDDEDAASAASFDPESAGSKLASEKSFDPDREEDEQDLSGFEDESKANVATISADVAQRVSSPPAASCPTPHPLPLSLSSLSLARSLSLSLWIS
jgi:hypothetical protein